MAFAPHQIQSHLQPCTAKLVLRARPVTDGSTTDKMEASMKLVNHFMINVINKSLIIPTSLLNVIYFLLQVCMQRT